MSSPIASTLSVEQVTRFDTAGFLVMPDLVPEDTVTALRAEADDVLAGRLTGMAATRRTDPRVTWWRLATGQPYVLKIKPVVDLMPTAARVAAGLDLTTIVADLLGATPHLMENKLMYKHAVDTCLDWADLPVLGAEVCKHTDAAYFSARGHSRVITVAISLDHCTDEAGALRVWPGSHKRPIDMIQTPSQGPVVRDADAPDHAAVTLIAAPGSVLVWDAALVHASGPNTTGRPRRLLVLGYAPAASGS